MGKPRAMARLDHKGGVTAAEPDGGSDKLYDLGHRGGKTSELQVSSGPPNLRERRQKQFPMRDCFCVWPAAKTHSRKGSKVCFGTIDTIFQT